MDKIIEDLKKEHDFVVRTFKNYHSYHEGFAVIKEELDELWDEVKGGQDKSLMYKEAIQVMSTAMRFILDLVNIEGVKNGKRN